MVISDYSRGMPVIQKRIIEVYKKLLAYKWTSDEFITSYSDGDCIEEEYDVVNLTASICVSRSNCCLREYLDIRLACCRRVRLLSLDSQLTEHINNKTTQFS